MNKKTKWLLVLIVFIILVIISFIIRGNVKAFNDNACWQGQAGDHNPHCIPTPSPTYNPCQTKDGMQWNDDYPCPTLTISPTAGESATPTASPEATITDSPSSQPFPSPTEGSGGYFNDGLGCGVHNCGGSSNSVSTPLKPPSTGRGI